MLRPYQVQWINDVYTAWGAGVKNVIGIAPTGAGKTVMLGHILRESGHPAAVIAHRQELLGQLALALNREKVPHSIIAPKETIRQIISLEMMTHEETYYRANALVRVASAQTIVRRDAKDPWFARVGTLVIDEGHHVLRENIWGRAVAMFPNALGLFPTAHALRGDGKGLGRHADGLADALVLGPTPRALIEDGYLTDYRLICPDSDVDISDVPIGADGDFNAAKLRAAIHESKTIVGDVVDNYLKFTPGMLGITFAVDVQAATEISAQYRKRGVPSEVLTAKTPTVIRAQLMQKFRCREILQLVNVDVLGEGVDVPAVEVVTMARHTASFQVYSQQFGRTLRPNTGFESEWSTWPAEARVAAIAASSKPKAIVIDHVNNYDRLGLPDRPRTYTLDRAARRSRKAKDDSILLRHCVNLECLQVFERFLSKCPHCGTPVPAPARRDAPEYVDGVLSELDPSVLKEMRGEIARIDGVAHTPKNAAPAVIIAITRRHTERQQHQALLRGTIALWAGWQRDKGLDDAEIYRKFFMKYRIDIGTAQTLGANDADELNAFVGQDLQQNGIIEVAL